MIGEELEGTLRAFEAKTLSSHIEPKILTGPVDAIFKRGGNS